MTTASDQLSHYSVPQPSRPCLQPDARDSVQLLQTWARVSVRWHRQPLHNGRGAGQHTCGSRCARHRARGRCVGRCTGAQRCVEGSCPGIRAVSQDTSRKLVCTSSISAASVILHYKAVLVHLPLLIQNLPCSSAWRGSA